MKDENDDLKALIYGLKSTLRDYKAKYGSL